MVISHIIMNIKVHIFWEGHKILRNLPLTFDSTVHTVKSKWKISQNFVAFSEYMNFTFEFQLCNDFQKWDGVKIELFFCWSVVVMQLNF